MKGIKISYIYVGSFQAGIIRPGFSHTNKYHRSRRIVRVLRHIINRGHEVTPINIEPYLTYEINPYVDYGLGACASLVQALRSPADIFLADYLEAGVLAYICKKTRGSPFAFDYRDNYTERCRARERARYILRLEKIISNRADKVIAASEDLRDRCISFGASERNIVTIPNGVDTNTFNPSNNEEKTKELRKKFNLTSPTIVFIGRHEPHYHLDVLIEAFSSIVKDKPLAKLLLVGGGRGTKNLKMLSEKLGVLGSVIFAGFQPYENIPHFINAADVAVSPLYSGLKVFEYMACGKPIVKTSAKRGEILEHMKSCFLVKERTPEEFARGITTIIEDRQLSLKMGRNARKLAVEKYDWEHLAERYISILSGLTCNAR